MSGIRKHFVERYFRYRRRYVAAIAQRAPHRLRLAIASEILRLGFVVVGSGFIGFIFAILAYGAFTRDGAALGPLVFVVCSGLALGAAALAAADLPAACADLRRPRHS